MTRADVGNPTRTAPEEPPLALERAFEFLANERRRAVVAHLLDAPHGVTVEELTDALADPGTEPACVATSLHHAHLPKLADAGVVEWDRGEYVQATPLLDALEPFLESVANFEERSQ